MMKLKRSYYLMEYCPNDNGVPHFFDKRWNPELPDYDIFTAHPDEHTLADEYKLRAATEKLTGDFLIRDNLCSSLFVSLCDKYAVSYISRPVDVQLSKKTKPEKSYHLFFLKDYIEILDKESSSYIISQNIDGGEYNEPDSRGIEKTYYDKIDSFIIKEEVDNHLFFCQEISQPVCSSEFKKEFEFLKLEGINFIPIDGNFSYDAWEGW